MIGETSKKVTVDEEMEPEQEHKNNQLGYYYTVFYFLYEYI